MTISQLGGGNHLATLPERATVDGERLAVDVGARAAGQVHDGAGNVLGLAEALHGVGFCLFLGAARRLHQTV